MILNEKIYNILCRLVQNPELIQEENETTKYISKNFELGTYILLPKKRRNSKPKFQFKLRPDEQEKLVAIILLETGFDIRKDKYIKQNLDRIKNTDVHNDEKLGSDATNDIVLLNVPDKKIRLNNEITSLFTRISSAGIELRHQQIETVEHECIVICENFAPMYYLENYFINTEMRSALFIYRGDSQINKNAKHVNEFIDRFRNEMPIFYFGDFDPSGLRIGIEIFKCGGILLPQIHKLKDYINANGPSLGRTDKYDKQIKHHPISCSSNNLSLHEHINFMRECRLGFQQEALIQKQIPLKLVKLKA